MRELQIEFLTKLMGFIQFHFKFLSFTFLRSLSLCLYCIEHKGEECHYDDKLEKLKIEYTSILRKVNEFEVQYHNTNFNAQENGLNTNQPLQQILDEILAYKEKLEKQYDTIVRVGL